MLVVTISNSALNGVLTMDMVKDNMFNKEARRKEQGTSIRLEALVTQSRARSKNKNFNNHKRLKSK